MTVSKGTSYREVDRGQIPPGVAKLLAAAKRAAQCRRRSVGAVTVNHHGGIIAVGWNGLQTGSCPEGDCPRGRLSYEEVPAFQSYAGNCLAIHAEDSALRASGNKAAVLYVTDQPCPGCEVLIEDYGISEIVVVSRL